MDVLKRASAIRRPRQAGASHSLGSSQQGATSTLCTFPVVEVAHFNFCCRGGLERGASSRIDAIPLRRARLRADKVLLVVLCGPGPDDQALVLGLDDKLQGVVNEAGRRRALVVVPHVTKGASFRGHLNLNPHELSRPFADEIRLGMRGGRADEEKYRQRDRVVASHDSHLPQWIYRRGPCTSPGPRIN